MTASLMETYPGLVLVVIGLEIATFIISGAAIGDTQELLALAENIRISPACLRSLAIARSGLTAT